MNILEETLRWFCDKFNPKQRPYKMLNEMKWNAFQTNLVSLHTEVGKANAFSWLAYRGRRHLPKYYTQRIILTWERKKTRIEWNISQTRMWKKTTTKKQWHSKDHTMRWVSSSSKSRTSQSDFAATASRNWTPA